MVKDERIQVRLNQESKKFLESLAKKEDRALSQLAGRIIDSHIDLLRKMGQNFHHEYARLIKSANYEDMMKAFSYLAKTDECIDEQIELGQIKKSVRK